MAGLFADGRGLDAGGVPILAFSHEGFIGVGWLAAGRGLDARDTPILAFPHEWGRDLSFAVHSWFWVANLDSTVWIPAFAGMTGRRASVERGRERFVRKAALARGAPILAFPHEGGWDPLASLGA